MNENKLKVNASKYIVIRNVRKELRRNIMLKSLNDSVRTYKKYYYLGVIIDSKLRFKDHCDYMLKKIGKKISFLNRIGSDISRHARSII